MDYLVPLDKLLSRREAISNLVFLILLLGLMLYLLLT